MTEPSTSFDTPEPIDADLSLEMANVRILAGTRTTTVVQILPRSPRRKPDVEAAARTDVSFEASRLLVRSQKSRFESLFGPKGAIEVVVQLPAGSQVNCQTGYGDIDTEGRLGACVLKTSYGSLRVDEAASLDVRTSAGDIGVGKTGGPAEISTSAGDIRVAEATATVNLKTSAGDIRVERASGDLQARTAYGSVKILEAAGGTVTLNTSYGDIEVGVRKGTSAFLDITSGHGAVRNELRPSTPGSAAGERVTVHARTNYGQIRIHRTGGLS